MTNKELLNIEIDFVDLDMENEKEMVINHHNKISREEKDFNDIVIPVFNNTKDVKSKKTGTKKATKKKNDGEMTH